MTPLYAFTERDAQDMVDEPLTPAELSSLAKSLEGVHEYVSEVAADALARILAETRA